MWAVEAIETQGHRLWNRHFWVVAQCNRVQKDFFRARVLTFFSTYYSYSQIVDPNYSALFDIWQFGRFSLFVHPYLEETLKDYQNEKTNCSLVSSSREVAIYNLALLTLGPIIQNEILLGNQVISFSQMFFRTVWHHCPCFTVFLPWKSIVPYY